MMNNDELIEKFEQEDITLASFQKRSLAYLIDEVLISVLFVFIIMDQVPPNLANEQFIEFINGFLVYIILLKVIYQTFFVWMYGASVGKIVMKIKIISTEDLDKPSLFSAFNRAVFRVIGEIFFYLGFFWAFLNPKRETWHDKIAKTLVVNA